MSENKKPGQSKAVEKLARDWISYYGIIRDPEQNTSEFQTAVEIGTANWVMPLIRPES